MAPTRNHVNWCATVGLSLLHLVSTPVRILTLALTGLPLRTCWLNIHPYIWETLPSCTRPSLAPRPVACSRIFTQYSCRVASMVQWHTLSSRNTWRRATQGQQCREVINWWQRGSPVKVTTTIALYLLPAVNRLSQLSLRNTSRTFSLSQSHALLQLI